MPPILETERLVLRPYAEADIEAAFALFEGHPDVYQHDPGFARTRDQRAAIVRRHAAGNQTDGEGVLAATLKSTGQMIGQFGLQLHLLPWTPFATPEVELFCKLGRAYWGAGYALEACLALMTFAFEELHLLRLVTLTQPANLRSVRLAARLGFDLAPAPSAWPAALIGVRTNPAAGSRT